MTYEICLVKMVLLYNLVVCMAECVNGINSLYMCYKWYAKVLLVLLQSMKSEMLTLEKHHMNVHQFNVSGANLEQSLHIHVELEPAKDKHVFPISILVR